MKKSKNMNTWMISKEINSCTPLWHEADQHFRQNQIFRETETDRRRQIQRHRHRDKERERERQTQTDTDRHSRTGQDRIGHTNRQTPSVRSASPSANLLPTPCAVLLVLQTLHKALPVILCATQLAQSTWGPREGDKK